MESGNELVRIETALPTIGLNFEEAKKLLEQEVAEYNIVVTADSVADAKKVATQLNKRAGEIDGLRKDAVAQVSEPIKEFDGQMRELVGICKEGRQKILDQVKRYEDETRAQADLLLRESREALWDDLDVKAEFRQADMRDLVKLTALTATGKLTKATSQELLGRVRDDKALQDRTERRLLELENRSYKAGLAAPLTRDHVEHFLFAYDDRYESELLRILDAEVERQETAEQRLRERQEREDRQARQAALETEERRQRIETHREQDQAKPAAPGKVAWRVTCTFSTEAPAHIEAEAIEAELRRVLANAGIKALTSVRAERVQEEAA